MLDFWDCLNVAIDYAKQTSNPNIRITKKDLKEAIKDCELKQRLLDNLFNFFINKVEFFITWDQIVELYELSIESVKLIDSDDSLDNILLFLEEIGFLFPEKEWMSRKIKLKPYEYLPQRFFLGWNKYNIEIVQESFHEPINNNVEDLKIFEEDKEIDDLKKNLVKPKNLTEISKNIVREAISKESIQNVSQDTGLTVKEIYQMGREYKIKLNDLMTERAGLYVVIEDLKKRAPLCKFIKGDNARCQIKIRHLSGFCNHHKKDNL